MLFLYLRPRGAAGAGITNPEMCLPGGSVTRVIGALGGVPPSPSGPRKPAGVVDKLTNSSSVELPGSETVPGTGSQFTVWATASNVNCTVNGGDVAFNTSASTSQSTDVNGESFDLVGWFDTTSGQDYSVGCDGLPGETFSVIELPFSAIGWGIGLLVGGLIGGVGSVAFSPLSSPRDDIDHGFLLLLYQ